MGGATTKAMPTKFWRFMIRQAERRHSTSDQRQAWATEKTRTDLGAAQQEQAKQLDRDRHERRLKMLEAEAEFWAKKELYRK